MRYLTSASLDCFADGALFAAAPSNAARRISDEHPRAIRRPSAELASRLQAQLPAKPPELSALDLKAQPALPISLIRPDPAKASGEEKEDDNWDSDFEEGISISKIAGAFVLASSRARLLIRFAALDREPGDQSPAEDEDGNSDTIRPPPSALNSPAIRPAPMAPIVEDYSDLVGEDDADPFEGRVASLQVRGGSVGGSPLLMRSNRSTTHQRSASSIPRISPTPSAPTPLPRRSTSSPLVLEHPPTSPNPRLAPLNLARLLRQRRPTRLRRPDRALTSTRRRTARTTRMCLGAQGSSNGVRRFLEGREAIADAATQILISCS